MHLRALLYLLAGLALAAILFHKYRPYGSRDGEIERRHPDKIPETDTPERRKDDQVGGES
jgi:hypothetical protein